MKIVIDTDAGIDDAHAIFIALSRPDVEVVAITTCHGNTNRDQVGLNVLRILKTAGRLDIPVYQGAEKPINGVAKRMDDPYHGIDGLGNVPDATAPTYDLVKTEPAASVIVRLASELPGEITLICLGPLTNIALAQRLDPGFSAKLKECCIMGGNYEGRGNITPYAEWNFYADPMAASVVLQEVSCKKTLVCWELCVKHSLPWDTYHQLRRGNSEAINLLRTIEKHIVKECHKKGWEKWILCDEVLMVGAIQPTVITEKAYKSVSVDTSGALTDGQMKVTDILDDNGTENGKAYIAYDINKEQYLEIIKNI